MNPERELAAAVPLRRPDADPLLDGSHFLRRILGVEDTFLHLCTDSDSAGDLTTPKTFFGSGIILDPRRERGTRPMKSLKLYWNEKTVNSGNVLELLFGDRTDTIDAAKLLIERMRKNPHLAVTKREMRFFAKELESGKLKVKYSYHNFYVKLLRKLVNLGFIQKEVLIWDGARKKTEAVYQLRLQSIPERGPQGGFIRQSWLIAKGWNDNIRP